MVNAVNKPTFPFLLNEYVVVAVPYYKWQKIRVKRALGGGKNQMGGKSRNPLHVLAVIFGGFT